MPDLRAPDPTLERIAPFELVGIDYDSGEPPIAHTVRWVDREYVPECADPECGGCETAIALHARWFSVPCWTCFPDAPPPGHDLGCHPECASAPRPDRNLAWQVRAWQVQP